MASNCFWEIGNWPTEPLVATGSWKSGLKKRCTSALKNLDSIPQLHKMQTCYTPLGRKSGRRRWMLQHTMESRQWRSPRWTYSWSNKQQNQFDNIHSLWNPGTLEIQKFKPIMQQIMDCPQTCNFVDPVFNSFHIIASIIIITCPTSASGEINSSETFLLSL
jgi:hypothetical protein